MPAIVPLPAAPSYRIVQVDPRYCEARAAAPMGARVLLTRDDVAIDANYFYYGRPLGQMVDHGRRIETLDLPPAKRTRPFLVVEEGRATLTLGDTGIALPNITLARGRDAIVPGNMGRDVGQPPGITLIQAGPLLIHGGRRVPDRGKFQRDVFRCTTRTALGVTRAGKVLLIYCECATVDQVTRYLLHHGAVAAMGLDSGSSASMHVRGRWYGNPRPYTCLRFHAAKTP